MRACSARQCAHTGTSLNLREHGIEHVCRAIDVGRLDRQRRQQAHDFLIGPVHEKTLLACGIDDGHGVHAQLHARA